MHCPPLGAAVRDPRRRESKGHRHRDRGHIASYGLASASWSIATSTGGGDAMLVETACLSARILRSSPATGMAGIDPIRIFACPAGAMTGCPAAPRPLLGRSLRHGIGQRARGHSRDRAVRPAAVSDRADVGVHEVHYAMIIILAMGIGLSRHRSDRLLCGLRHRPRRSCRGHSPHLGYLLALLIGLILWRFSVDLDRFSSSGIKEDHR